MADASALEEKLEVLADLKIQMRGKKRRIWKKEKYEEYFYFYFYLGLTNDNEEIKQTQEEVNTTLLNMNHHMTTMAEAIER